jgi:hypothetical protein
MLYSSFPFLVALALCVCSFLVRFFVGQKFDVNAASLKDIGDFDKAKYKNVKLDDRFRQRVKNFHFVSIRALQVL